MSKEETPFEKALYFCDAVELLTESRPTELDKVAVSKFFVDTFLSDLSESFEVAQELHPQAQGLIAGSIVIWTEIKKELEKLETQAKK
jgi:hypothetical protein